jgi:hypothetical protein
VTARVAQILVITTHAAAIVIFLDVMGLSTCGCRITTVTEKTWLDKSVPVVLITSGGCTDTCVEQVVPHVASSMSHQMVTKVTSSSRHNSSHGCFNGAHNRFYVLHAAMKLHESAMRDANNDAYVAQWFIAHHVVARMPHVSLWRLSWQQDSPKGVRWPTWETWESLHFSKDILCLNYGRISFQKRYP